MPLWGKILIGCGLLLVLLLVLAGFGLSRFMVRGRAMFQTQFCAQNLRAAQRGFELYSQDYDQTLPKAVAWMDAVTPYVKGQLELRCPVVRASDPKGFGYAFNSALSGVKTAKIAAPTTTAVVYDSTDKESNASDAFTSLPAPPRHSAPGGRGAVKRPSQFNIVLYADGHVRFLSADGSTSDAGGGNVRRGFFSARPKTK
jgi:hypothetical protein